MLDNVALNVVIGLVFIYLLYSLFATVLSEIIATKLGLRARNLKEGIDRMLNDDKSTDDGFWKRLWDSLRLMKNPKNDRIEKFYSNPEIKYLGSSGIFKNPSSFKAVTFSRTLLYELTGGDLPDMNLIRQELLHCIDPGNNPRNPALEKSHPDIFSRVSALDNQSAQFVLSLFNDSYGDLVKFKLNVEAWFDRTMEQTTEWYKRKIQVVLLVLGFMMAWFFNADTFTIISKLSTDKDARDKIVTLAVAYSKNSPAPADPNFSLSVSKLDSLNNVKKKLEQDIVNANTILGLGGWAPDLVRVTIDDKTKEKIYTPQIDYVSLSAVHQKETHIIEFTRCEKWAYFFRLFPHHFFGFLITAIAISLGAPFWYDLLNKLMSLRTSQKQDTNSTNTTASGVVSPLNREA
jgi:hypothetical protein